MKWLRVAIGVGGAALAAFLIGRQSAAAVAAAGSLAIPVGSLPNARRVPEGYVVGGLIQVNDVPALLRNGIQSVVSLVAPDSATRTALGHANIRLTIAPMGSTWRGAHPYQIISGVTGVEPRRVYIHCTHGVDRAGTALAFLLVERHGWTIADALYAVVQPTRANVEGLAEILADKGIDDRRAPDDPGVGIYSLAPLGRVGGLKTTSDSYANLVRTFIDEVS